MLGLGPAISREFSSKKHGPKEASNRDGDHLKRSQLYAIWPDWTSVSTLIFRHPESLTFHLKMC
jgi:hypothetical protein